MKKGIVEVADIIVVNKADGDLLSSARHTKTDYMHAVQLLPIGSNDWLPKVLLCSCMNRDSTSKLNIRHVWKNIEEYYDFMFRGSEEKESKLTQKRADQRVRLLYDYMYAALLMNIKRSSSMKLLVHEVEKRLKDNELVPRVAAHIVLQKFQQQEHKEHQQHQQQQELEQAQEGKQ
jgi:LAO/AO transport system kinase